MQSRASSLTEADRPPLGAPGTTLLDGFLDRTDPPGNRAALLDRNGRRLGTAAFADSVRRAATGLVRRGLRPDDTIGVLAPVGIDRAVAVYTALAAGANALPLEVTSDLETLIGALAETDARLLITTPGLTTIAFELAERSRIRQVFAFGRAPATTPFSELMRTACGKGDYDPRHVLLDNGILSCRGRETLLHGHDELVSRLHRLDAPVRVGAEDVLALSPALREPECSVLVALALSRGATVLAGTSAADGGEGPEATVRSTLGGHLVRPAVRAGR